jgi:ubiquinone biosynthesis accessory factor UbiK
MIDHKTIDELARTLSDAMPEGIKMMQSDIENNIRAILEASFTKMNLISRDEFNVQTALLARTREKLDLLEKQLQQLEK